MKTVQPIRDINKIEKLKSELQKTGYRNYFLFVFGINTGLRISDILKLKVQDLTLPTAKAGDSKVIKGQFISNSPV